MTGLYNPPLQIVGFIGTRQGDAERGPEIRLNAYEAHIRMIGDGELVWVYGPRRHDLTAIRIDDSVPRGGIVARDVAGLAITEIVRLVRVHSDRSPITPAHA